MVDLLIKLGVKVNEADVNGLMPLFAAVLSGQSETVESLLNAGANIEEVDEGGFTPLAHALMEQPHLCQLLENRGADRRFADDCLRVKLVGHVFGLDCTTTVTNQEGAEVDISTKRFRSPYMMTVLRSYVDEFFKKNIVPGLAGSTKEWIKTILGRCIYNDKPILNMSDIILSIRSGVPFTAMGGSVDHTIGIIIINNKLIICDRDTGRMLSTAASFQLPKEGVSSEFINKLSRLYLTTDSFYDMLYDLNLTYLGGYDQKGQKVSNCTWIAAKGLFGIICRELTNDVTGKEIYKAFTRFSRKKTLDDYIFSSTLKDSDLLEEALIKARKKGLYPPKQLNLYGRIIWNS